MKLVLDTNVIVAGLRSPTGASAALLKLAFEGGFRPLLSTALALEYEYVCAAPEQRSKSGLSIEEVQGFVSALLAIAEPIEIHFLWRPQLIDPADEMVLEVAINGRADGLVTFNIRDFGRVPDRFGFPLLKPQAALRRLQQ